MKTFQQFSETMMMALRHDVRRSTIDPNDRWYTFEYEGQRYQVSLISRGRDGDGNRRGSISFALVDNEGFMEFDPTNKKSGTFQILATVVKVLDDAFNKHGFAEIEFNAKGKLIKLYDAMAKKLGDSSKYWIERNDGGSIIYYKVMKK